MNALLVPALAMATKKSAPSTSPLAEPTFTLAQLIADALAKLQRARRRGSKRGRLHRV